MSFSSIFIRRPIATTLLALALSVLGVVSFFFLPVAPLPQMALPMIFVRAQLSGASAETMATSVATPLERSLGGISGLSAMSSNSSEGETQIFLEFDSNKDVDEAAQEVQGAINAARPLLPSSMKQPPSYKKLNPSSSPIMSLALTSEVYDQGQLYDIASTILSQKLAQIEGVGEVSLGGSSLPAVRVDLNPYAMNAYGVSINEVRQTISAANSITPTGLVEDEHYRWQIKTNGKLAKAKDFRDLVVRWQGDNALRLKDIANVYDYIESEFNSGFYNDKKAVNLIIRREESANIIKTVDSIKASIPSLRALLPESVTLTVAQDRSPSIRATLQEAELTLIIAIVLVVMVVWLFLGRWRATLIPAISVPVSLLGTFIAIYLLGYSLNTISLMALIVVTGFVVDDSIVVLENIMRYIEQGESPYRASIKGASEVGFTVLSMSLSLIAVFIPLLLMNDFIGQLFREFAVTLSVSILVSLVVSLTLTPSLCARWLHRDSEEKPKPRFFVLFDKFFNFLQAVYKRSLAWVLKFKFTTLMVFLVTVALNVAMFIAIPKGTFPTQDTGVVMGFFRVDTGTSFQAMLPKLDYYRKIILADENVDTVMGFAGGRGGSNSSFLLIQLKSVEQRQLSAQKVIDELRRKFGKVPGAQISLVVQQDIRLRGGPPGGSTGSYDVILKGSDLALLKEWTPKVKMALEKLPELTDVMEGISDQGRRVELKINRDAVARLGINMNLVSNMLGNLFGSGQVSVLYENLNQYYVVMNVAREFSQDPSILKDMMIVTTDGARIPLSAIAEFTTGSSPSSVRHQGLQVSNSVSYNLAPGITAAQATQAIQQAVEKISLPTKSIQLEMGSDAQLLQQTEQQQPLLILAAIIVMYIVLGILYESFVLPITILSTLPSAGLGAFMALRMVNMEFTLIAMIGVFLLIGIVKKNAIMMVDFAVSRERAFNEPPEKAIFEACVTRFRPIMMTTFAAILGAIPLIIATGAGVEMRQPLGVTIVGGLVLSQLLTLYTTPVIYLLLDKMRHHFMRKR
ncbi:efflux RND transporter permease subunit [Pelistega europaea]|uniref:MMPL family transporter n=1 Tax=Pelistega europaea TaxID=106147 RepID=A0A7Y4LBC4_9BURK|nr:efflux RND transporter permease subunit [Pelistega europaea]NOL50394.1 MMPL family transporter [Pelistega europaea]